MSNYGAIPSSTSTAEYQNPATPQLPSTRTASLPRSVSRSHSRDSSNDGLAAAKSNANGDDRGSRNVRFTSPQRRTRFSERTANGTLNGASAEDTNSVADSELSESHAGHAIRARGVNSDGGRGGDDGRDEEGNGEEEDVPAWAAKLRERLKPTVVLENSGSVARDHLASERTFLAYVRTSLAIASSGVGECPSRTPIDRLSLSCLYLSFDWVLTCVAVAALVQLFTISVTSSSGTRLNSHLQRFARPLGALVVCMGIVLLLVSTSILSHPACFFVCLLTPSMHIRTSLRHNRQHTLFPSPEGTDLGEVPSGAQDSHIRLHRARRPCRCPLRCPRRRSAQMTCWATGEL